MSSSMDRLRAKLGTDTPSSSAPGFWESIAAPGSAIKQIPTGRLHSYAKHTFRLRDTDEFRGLVASVRANGVKEPLLVRPFPGVEGDYEIIAGHRRHKAAELSGQAMVPCIVENLSDREADQLMAESNIQRPGWLPSERARTFKLYLEAARARGEIRIGRPAKSNGGTEFHAFEKGTTLRDAVAQRFGLSGKAFEQYIKLNDLIPELLDLTDDDRILVKAAYQLAFVFPASQRFVADVLRDHPEVRINAAQGAALRAAGIRLSVSVVEDILGLGAQPRQRPVSYTDFLQTPRDVVRRYKQDETLQRRIADVIDRYIAEREAQA